MASSLARSEVSAATHELLTAVGTNPINKLLKLARKGEINDDVVASCWESFGSYVARVLRSGKGVTVPKLGNFTFASSEVDLAGTTNPASRDKQTRNPIFVISKEFLPRGRPLRPGMQHPSGIRPTDVKGVSGAIPLVKATFVDIAIMAGVPKDVCRVSLQRIFASLSDRVLAGQPVKFDIPHVGSLCIRNQIAAVIFLPELLEDVRGHTLRVHTNKLFANDIARSNLKVIEGHHDLFRTKGLIPDALKGTSPYYSSTPGRRPLSHQRSFRQDSAIKTIDHFFSNETPTPARRPLTAGRRPMTTRMQTSAGGILSDINPTFLSSIIGRTAKLRFAMKDRDTFGQKCLGRGEFLEVLLENAGEEAEIQALLLLKMTRAQDGRAVRYDEFFERLPGILVQYKQQYKTGSITPHRPSVSARSSRVFTAPTEVQIFSLAIELSRRKEMLLEQMQRQGVDLRSKQTPSEMFSHFKKSGGLPHIVLATLQALLRQLALLNPQLGLHSASLLELFKRVKPFIENGGRYITTFTGGTASQASEAIQQVESEDAKGHVNMLRDIFYNQKRTLRQIFNEFAKDEKIDKAGFAALLHKYKEEEELTSEEGLALFLRASQGKSQLSFPQFERSFKWNIPYSDWETVALHRLKHWMYENGLNAEDGFNRILSVKTSHAKTLSEAQSRISKADFSRFLKKEQIQLSSPQVDILFRSLDADGDGYLDFHKFESKLFGGGQSTIAGSPLTQLRETIVTNDIKPDDVLRKMKLYVWDGPFDLNAFSKHILLLNPQLSKGQIRKMFKEMEQGGQVQLGLLMRNLCGEAFETVDFRNKQMSQIYDYLQKKPRLSHKLVSLCQKADDSNLGTIEPLQLKRILQELELPMDEASIDRFIRHLSRDKEGRVEYLSLIEKMETVGNKNHNPFRTLVQRIKKFLDTNKYSPAELIHLLGGTERVPLDKFADFLQKKVDKQRSQEELLELSSLLDVDKDGHIDICDLQTCVGNLGSLAFFRDGGAALSFGSRRAFFPTKGFDNEQHLSAVCSTVKNAISSKRQPISDVFLQLDTNHDGLLSFTEFSQGIGQFVQLSQPVKERLFATMDLKKLGVVDYDSFVQIIESGTYAVKRRQEVHKESDNFHWQEAIIEKIRDWIRRERLSADHAFKNFDHDFDGLVGKADLKWALVNILDVDPLTFNDIQIDRLLILLDHRKRGSLRLEDFARLAGDIGMGSSASESVSLRPLSEGPGMQADYDWKLHSRQQIGLVISRRFSSIEESFEKASERRCDKVTFEQFCRFLEQYQALRGFNMTKGLIRELFGYLDPHKKGYVSQVDWTNAFSGFNWSRQVLEEFQSALSGNFASVQDAYAFFGSHHNDPHTQMIEREPFTRAVNSLTSKRFKQTEITALWNFLVEGGGGDTLSKLSFMRQFSPLHYTAQSMAGSLVGSRHSSRKFSSSVTAARSKSLISLRSGGGLTSTAVWDTTGIFERLKYLIRASNSDVAKIFKTMDKDKSGKLTPIEFRNGIRKLGLGLSSRDIDHIVSRLDSNADGLIDYEEFARKLKPRESDLRIIDRSRTKVDTLRDMMFRHLISPRDAFSRFDSSRAGKLSYGDFNLLVNTAYKAAHQELPSYPVLKDLFDVIDIRKDGIIDLSEWLSIFKEEESGSVPTTTTPMSNSFSTSKIQATRKSRPTTACRTFHIDSELLQQNWEDTREYESVLSHIGRNRKLLAQALGTYASGGGLVSYERAGRILRETLLPVVGALNDRKLRILLKAGEKEGKVDYRRLLQIYKERVMQRVSHPKRVAWE